MDFLFFHTNRQLSLSLEPVVRWYELLLSLFSVTLVKSECHCGKLALHHNASVSCVMCTQLELIGGNAWLGLCTPTQPKAGVGIGLTQVSEPVSSDGMLYKPWALHISYLDEYE